MTKTHVAPFGSGDTDWQPVLTTPWYTMSRRGDWYSVMTSSGLHPATIFAVDAHDQVLLLEVYRPALDRVVIETPRGLVDEGETARQGAAREFSEETGITIRAEDLVPLGRIFPDSGILRSEIEVFGLRHPQAFVPVSANDAVILGHRLVPLSDMADMVASGEISDSITISAWQRSWPGKSRVGWRLTSMWKSLTRRARWCRVFAPRGPPGPLMSSPATATRWVGAGASARADVACGVRFKGRAPCSYFPSRHLRGGLRCVVGTRFWQPPS